MPVCEFYIYISIYIESSQLCSVEHSLCDKYVRVYSYERDSLALDHAAYTLCVCLIYGSNATRLRIMVITSVN